MELPRWKVAIVWAQAEPGVIPAQSPGRVPGNSCLARKRPGQVPSGARPLDGVAPGRGVERSGPRAPGSITAGRGPRRDPCVKGIQTPRPWSRGMSPSARLLPCGGRRPRTVRGCGMGASEGAGRLGRPLAGQRPALPARIQAAGAMRVRLFCSFFMDFDEEKETI